MTDTLIIEPGMAERRCWLDLWCYRELCYVLAWSDIAVRFGRLRGQLDRGAKP
jgi:lipopolysaccharide transport system permease protein